ncbi:hypothetical protein DPMN_147693 [Dreissena polymorpha]|uniref:Uncharacterized protein n=1 Tax=Dreissena polymorpha TaxID=45954 RepID=A0A9D4FE62_DREPO|nr:hypothetical protein DPMN_147693 [Dreissena polymorpha]
MNAVLTIGQLRILVKETSAHCFRLSRKEVLLDSGRGTFSRHSFQEFIDSAKRQAFKQAFWRGRHDKNILLFAFAGFVVARQSEGDKRLSEIQDIINVKDQSDDLELPSLTFLGRELPLDIFEIGRNIRQGCDNAVYETRCNSAVDEVAETEETDQTDSDQCEFENEESKTESEITTQFLTSQDASASFVFKVHEYYDESLIRGGSDETTKTWMKGN